MSRLQEPFLRELAANFVATQRRIVQRLADVDPSDVAGRDVILRDEMQGLYHGVLVILDGGTALADKRVGWAYSPIPSFLAIRRNGSSTPPLPAVRHQESWRCPRPLTRPGCRVGEAA